MKDWKKEFDKIWGSYNPNEDSEGLDKKIKDFINKKLDPIKISMLRQWLNEDRITEPKKMVTNADIEFWLGMIGSEELIKRNKAEKRFWNKTIKKIRESLINNV